MHDSSVHRQRSTSAPKTNHPGNRRIQNYESEVIPGSSYPTNNPVNFFDRKN